MPTKTPLHTPPITKPNNIVQFGIGEINNSSIDFWNLTE